jgi:hypothetical protein
MTRIRIESEHKGDVTRLVKNSLVLDQVLIGVYPNV